MERVQVGQTGQAAKGVTEGTVAVTRTFGPGQDVTGLEFARYFTREGGDPFDEVEWELRSALIANERGELVFEQRDVEFPKFWSQQATNIVVSKYFRGQIGTPERERSVKQLIGRVVDTITSWARAQGYFASEDDLQAFSDELKHLLVYQKGSFNSPVWFNCGFEKAPQCSACFINSVQDTMDSILALARTEGMLFKFGSGTGSNLSAIRSSQRTARRRRHGLGSGVVHEGLRRVRRRHQVGRQDAPRGEDGHPQRRSSGHRRVHQLQGRGREEGLGAHRRRLRRLVHGPGLRVGLLPELEQLGARDRRVHARGARRRRLADARRAAAARRHGHLQGARSDAADRRGDLDLRRSGHAVRHDGQRLAHVPEHGAHQREQPVLGVHVPRRLGVQPGVDQPDEVRAGTTASSTPRRSARRARRSSRRRRSSSTTRAIRRRRSSGTATTTGRSASATRTSARC